VYFPESEEVRKVRCVRFTSDAYCTTGRPTENPIKPDVVLDEEIVVGKPLDVRPQAIPEPEPGVIGENQPEPEQGVHVIDENRPEPDRNVQNEGRPSRRCVKPKYLDDYSEGEEFDSDIDDNVNCTIDYCYKVTDVPKTYQDAVTSSKSNKWQKAMVDEMSVLRENETFEMTPLPEGRKSVGGRWVYAVMH
jgi:hypothetical protein